MINDGTVKWEIRNITEAENSKLLNDKTAEQIINETLDRIPEKTKVLVTVGAVKGVVSSGSIWDAVISATIPLPSGYNREQCRYWVEPILYEQETYSWRMEPGIKDIDQSTGKITNVKKDKTYYYLCIAVK